MMEMIQVLRDRIRGIDEQGRRAGHLQEAQREDGNDEDFLILGHRQAVHARQRDGKDEEISDDIQGRREVPYR